MSEGVSQRRSEEERVGVEGAVGQEWVDDGGKAKVEGSKRLLSERRGMTRKESEFAGRRFAEESRAGICGVAGSVGAARVGAESGGAAV